VARAWAAPVSWAAGGAQRHGKLIRICLQPSNVVGSPCRATALSAASRLVIRLKANPYEAPRRQRIPLQCAAMFAARPFALNTASAATACKAARAITTKTTTIKG